MKIETLCENPWLELKKVVDPENGVNGYVFSHEKRCDGKIISVLPYRIADGGIQYLLRQEVTPCWGMESVVSSITGGYEGGDILDDVVKEMKEEAGYTITKDEVIQLGTCFGAKSSDTVYSLYSVDLTGKDQGQAKGDGSELEAKAHCFWAPDISKARDPFVYVSFFRIQQEVLRNIFDDFKRKVVEGSGDIDPKMMNLIDKNFWGLLAG